MANTKISGEYKEFASVDSSVGTGYATNPVGMRSKGLRYINFSIRDQGASAGDWAGTIKLQFKHEGDAEWTTYEEYTEVTRKIVEGQGADVQWRALASSYSAGAVIFGFDW
jgi:hypothetical protein